VQRQLQELIDSIDRSALSEPPDELHQFAKQETFPQHSNQERRRHRRYSLITNVIAVPIDKRRLCAVGPPFVALSSGMSEGGMRLIHTHPLPSDCLVIEIENQPVRFVFSVMRSHPVGHCFETAGQLMNSTPAVERIGVSRDFGPVTCDSGREAVDLLAHWAGVSAAVELLKAEFT
jgi:hypothetical protein